MIGVFGRAKENFEKHGDIPLLFPETDLVLLRNKLSDLLIALRRGRVSAKNFAEQKRIAAAENLLLVTIDRIDKYQAGERRIPRENIFQETISNCTRGFPEIGANSTEEPGEVASLIKGLLDYALACRGV